jgi:hypothetical protein
MQYHRSSVDADKENTNMTTYTLWTDRSSNASIIATLPSLASARQLAREWKHAYPRAVARKGFRPVDANLKASLWF